MVTKSYYIVFSISFCDYIFLNKSTIYEFLQINLKESIWNSLPQIKYLITIYYIFVDFSILKFFSIFNIPLIFYDNINYY